MFVLLLLLHCFSLLVFLLCCVFRSSLYCNIPSDLCTLCLSCYFFNIVLSLYLYCWCVMYPDHHFTVISLQTLRGHHGPDQLVLCKSVPIITDFVNSNLDQGEVYNIMWYICLWLATGCWFFPGHPVSSTNKTDRHEITEIFLKVVLNTIKQTNKPLDLG